ncbi:hypothetical protein Lal_00004175 [Lupinus albus]|nr:hypothetical protein Lal_00004175 [Lupinus albus]
MGCFSAFYNIQNALFAELKLLITKVGRSFGWNVILLWWWIFSRGNAIFLGSYLISRLLATVGYQQWNSRGGNSCADKLAVFRVSSKMFTWWDVTPNFISDECIKNRLGLPNYICIFL